jgi:endothelin-converting enzyme/putative endopeptidase
MRKTKLGFAAAILLAGTAPLLAQSGQPAAANPAPAAKAGAAQGKAKYGNWGVDLEARDLSVKPGDDFWRHANNNWFKNNPIPADRQAWGVAYLLGDELNLQLKAILETAAASSKPAERQVADLYAGYMDEAGIEARGTAPLRPYLARIDSIKTRDQLLAHFATPGFTSPMGVGIIPNPADPTRYVAIANQGGLGMPGRDYYLKEGAQYDKFRTAYRDYVVQVHKLAGIADAEAKADAIIALERKIAEVHWTPERSRDARNLANVLTRPQLAQLAPQFDWPKYLERRGLGGQQTVIVPQSTAISGIGQLLGSVPLETWKAYSAYHLIRNAAPYLPKAFDQANFNFFGRTLGGAEQQQPRWKRGLGVVNGTLGEAVGQMYMERHFPAASRQQMGELIANLRGAFAERLQRLEWMDDPTRAQALAKLDAFDPRIGGPTKYIDYSALKVERGDPAGNMLRAAQFAWNLQLSRLPKPVDRSLWGMTPQTINASYNALQNQMTFPAAILQPPFFDPNADPAVNYGSIGAVIGHEIGHGFDDNGRRFDAQGRLRDWWTASSGEKFAERAARLRDQYGQYEALPGLKVNGQLTLGENIGDLGGLEMAYAAYRRHVAKHGEPAVIDGLTGDQRFFLAFAQAWRQQNREGALRQQVLTDTHSPAEFRANGTVRNMDAWYKAFDVKPGDKLYLPPEQRVRIW